MFDGEPLDPHDLSALFDLSSAFGDTLRLVLPYDLPHVAELVEVADRLQLSHEDCRDEIDDWLRADGDAAVDGICADGLAVNWLRRYFATAKGKARRDRALINSASAIMVVAADDDPTSLLKAGETLERLLLTLTSLHLQYSIITSPIEVAHLRDRIWMLAAAPYPPQVLIRIGRARAMARATPRRRLEAVMK